MLNEGSRTQSITDSDTCLQSPHAHRHRWLIVDFTGPRGTGIKKEREEIALGSPSNSPRRCWVPLYFGVPLAADPLVPEVLCSPPSSPKKKVSLVGF